MANINENTVLQFNLKWFLGIIISLVTAFAGFYYTIQKPNNDTIKIHMDEIMIKEREYQDLRFQKLDEMNQKLDDLENTVNALSKRNIDLNELRTNVGDSGATLGN